MRQKRVGLPLTRCSLATCLSTYRFAPPFLNLLTSAAPRTTTSSPYFSSSGSSPFFTPSLNSFTFGKGLKGLNISDSFCWFHASSRPPTSTSIGFRSFLAFIILAISRPYSSFKRCRRYRSFHNLWTLAFSAAISGEYFPFFPFLSHSRNACGLRMVGFRATDHPISINFTIPSMSD